MNAIQKISRELLAGERRPTVYPKLFESKAQRPQQSAGVRQQSKPKLQTPRRPAV